MYKFNIGQTVYLAVFLERSLGVSGGAYVITKRLPEHDGEFEYRIKSVNEPVHEDSRHRKTRASLSACYQEQSCPSPARLGAYRPDCSFGETR